MTEANPRETTFVSKNREFRKIEGSNNRDCTIICLDSPLKLNVFLVVYLNALIE